jgi:gliding motility-associated-like protein
MSFSPNYDGLNDKFKAEGINFDTYEMRIFDRWGNYIYQTTDANASWDGTYRDKPADIGVYAYYVVIKFINGNIIERKGDVLLVR